MGTLRIRWEEFESNIKNGFSQLRADEDFYDVTLACGDNIIKAHKVILGTASSVFKSLLKSLSHQHPLLYLRGIDFAHLKLLISFIYQGEVHIKSDDLKDFIALAQEMKVQSLMDIHQGDKSAGPPPKKFKHPESSTSLTQFEEITVEPSLGLSLINESDSVDSYNLHEDEEYEMDDEQYISGIEEKEFNSFDKCSEYGASEKKDEFDEMLDAMILKHMTTDDNIEFRCLKCPHSCLRKRDMMNHIEAKHLELNRFPCNLCNKRYNTRVVLKKHKRQVHNITKFNKGSLTPQASVVGDCLEIQSSSYDDKNNDMYFEMEEEESEQSYSDELIDAELLKFITTEDNVEFRCLKCSHTSSRKRDMMNHVEALHLEFEKFTCNICKKRYNTRVILRKHKRLVHKVKFPRKKECSPVQTFPYIDEDDTLEINPEESIGIDEADESEDFPVVNPIEDTSSDEVIELNLKSDKMLDEEILKYMSCCDEKLEFRCLKCPHLCHRKRDMMNHIESKHLKLEKFPCSICNQLSRTRVALKKHMRVSHKIFQHESKISYN